MQDSDKPRFATALGAVGMTFGVEVGKDLARGYWMGLSDLDIDSVEHALAESIRRCRFMPKPVEIRELAGATTPERAAVEAWEAVPSLAAGSSAAHPDPVAARVMRAMGGGRTFGQMTDDELHVWARKRFVEMYQAFAEAEARPSAQHQLGPGTDEDVGRLVDKVAGQLGSGR